MTRLLDLQKNSRERIRAEVFEYKGKAYIDLRIWFVGTSGELTRSSKGIMLRPDQVGEVAQGLMVAARAIEPTGVR